MLGHRAARAGGDQRRGGGDVERPAPAAGARPCRAGRRARPRPGRPARASPRARPASSSTVSPLVRSAIRKAAIWTSVASPAMISAEHGGGLLEGQVPAVGERVDRPGEQVGGAHALTPARHAEEVGQQLVALLGEDRLGVELHPFGGQLAMADRHHDPVGRRLTLEHVGKLADRRPASGSGPPPAGRQPAEDRAAVVLDDRRLAVDRVVGDDASTQGLHERLVAQADAEHRDPGLGEAAHRLQRDAGVVRGARARARRSPGHSRGSAAPRPWPGRCARPRSRARIGQLAQVLDEVVGEAVVVVDDEHAHDGEERSSGSGPVGLSDGQLDGLHAPRGPWPRTRGTHSRAWRRRRSRPRPGCGPPRP